jgi:peptidoglycan hydrolase-like protein with peptidoglycan-binding domain
MKGLSFAIRLIFVSFFINFLSSLPGRSESLFGLDSETDGYGFSEEIQFSGNSFSSVFTDPFDSNTSINFSDLQTFETNLESSPTLEQVRTVAEFQANFGTQNSAADLGRRRKKAQVTSVSQLSDIQPTDWAFQALQSLVERYGCIAGYPDGTFKGNRALTRYEFAAGVNSCLERITELLQASTEALVSQDDLKTVERLQTDFATELAQLRGQILGLEARTAELEANQFSTTTTLFGINTVTFQGRTNNQADIRPRDGEPETDDPGNSINAISFNYLQFDTRFDYNNLLRLGLLNITGSTAPRLSNDVRLGTDYFDTNQFVVGELTYRFLLGNSFAGYVGTVNVNAVTAFRGPNRFEGAATGPLSFFAQRNPLLNIGFGQTGLGFDWQFARRVSLQAVYSSTISELFSDNGHNTAAIQLAITPIDPVDLTIYYVYDYSPNGSLFSFVGDEQLTATNPVTGESAALRTDAIGSTLTWQITPKLTLGGWFGLTSSWIPGESGRVETTNYMVFLNFPDLFGDGNLGGLYVGQPPKIVHSNLPDGDNIPDSFDTGLGRSGSQPGTTTHVEAFYRWQVTDNISVTPGVILIFQPGHTPDSDTIGIGAIRTTFIF